MSGRVVNPMQYLLLLWVVFAAHNALSREAVFDREVDQLLNDQALVGVVWGIYTPEGGVSGAAGMADVSSELPMQSTTKVNVGSVTKTALALGVLRLISEDRLSLNTNVEKLLPHLNWDNPWANDAPIRVQHLLEHTAGLDNIRIWQFLNSTPTGDTPLHTAFPPSHSGLLRVRTRPGSQYSYSNMGYALLGMTIEAVTNQRYEDYLQAALLSPLGMENSTFHFRSQREDAALAMGYLDAGIAQENIPMFLRPAGQFTTTAEDMLLLVEYLLGVPDPDRAPYILPELMEKLGMPSTTDAFHEGLENGHGLALSSRDRHGVLGYCHPGTTFGFRAYLCLFPEERKGYFYAINTDSEQAEYEKFNELFIERLNLASPAQAVPAAQFETIPDYTGLYVLSPNSMAEFEWLDYMFSSIWVSETDAGLLIESLQKPPRALEPVTAKLFRDSDRLQPSHVFAAGTRTTLSDGLKTYERQAPWMLLFNWMLLLAGVAGLVFLFFRGTFLLFAKGSGASKILLLPYLNIVAFAIPGFLFIRQGFIHFGEKTAASISLAILSGLLPVTLFVSILYVCRGTPVRKTDLAGCFTLLSLCILLIYADVLPLVFWR